MMRILGWIVLVPLALLLIAFCVLNRTPVTLSMDLFGTAPQLVAQIPLFVLVLATLILGVVLGGLATFWSQAWSRSRATRRQEEIERLRAEVAASNERLRVVREERDRERAVSPASVAAGASPGSTALAAPGRSNALAAPGVA